MTRIPLTAVACWLALQATPALAQDAAPVVEIFGGYSRLSAGPDDFPRQTSNGVQIDVAANLNRWFGVVGDIAAHFNTARNLGPGFEGLVARTSVRQYLVGPRFTGRAGQMDVFAHALVGIASGDAGEAFSGFSDSALMLGGGGGVDVHVNRRLSVRAQFDRLGAFVDIAEVTSRFALGLVVRFGN
jgi:hypothetical protein